MEGGGGVGATRRFDGAREDAARRYWKWRKWAKAYLRLLQGRHFLLEALGSAVFCLLAVPAEMVWKVSRSTTWLLLMVWSVCFNVWTPVFLILEVHDKIGESLDEVFRLRVEKGERTAACTGRGRELLDKTARGSIELPELARGYLMLRRARLGPQRKAIVLAAGQSCVKQSLAQALRSAIPRNLATMEEFVYVVGRRE